MKKDNFRKFLGYYRIYWKRFVPVMLAALLASLASLFLPLCTRHIAQLTSGGAAAAREVARTGAVMAVLIALYLSFHYYYDYFGHALGARMESDLRNELFAHLEGLSFSFYDQTKVAHLMSSLTNDLLNLSELFHHGPEDYAMNLVRLIGASVVLLSIRAELAGIVIAIAALMIAATILWGKRLRRISAENQARIADINADAADVLGGIRAVQAFTQEEAQRRRFERAGERFFVSRKAVYRNEAYADKTIAALTLASTAAVAVLGGLRMADGAMSAADLIAFLMYVGYVTEPVQHLTWMITQFQTGMAGFDRVMNLLRIEPEIADAPDCAPLPRVSGAIDVQDVSFGYRDGAPVLQKLSLHVPAGQFLAVVGASGAGKSTLCALLPRFYAPDAGAILLDDADISRVPLQALRSSIAWVQQDACLFGGTIAENIRMGRTDATDEDVRRAAVLAEADAFIRALPDGYDSRVGERGVRLSGGQRQRIALARAFLKDAPVLILDEATSALDNLTEQRIVRALRENRRGRTTLVIAHRLSTVRNADRIVVLQNGGVCEDGTHETLMAEDGLYAALYRRQA